MTHIPPPTGTPPADSHLDEQLERLQRARRALSKIVFGQERVIEEVLIGLMASGHVLVEGAPGLGKTLLVRTLGAVCGLQFSRIQFTPDLMPADITGAVVLVHDDHGRTHARFQPGPLFAQMVLTDEINRATPKTQSALLEAMQERTVTVAGVPHQLPRPFFVLATQNPIEMEGTYVLPEAQIDRFLLNIVIPYPKRDVLDTILSETTGGAVADPEQVLEAKDILELQRATRAVPVTDRVRGVVVHLLDATQAESARADPRVARFVRFGITPRGGQALLLAAKAHSLMQGRFHVAVEDVRSVLRPVLRHRFAVNYVGEAEGVSAMELLEELFEAAVADRAT
jgi:MoxR-like ATPase